MKIKQQKQIKTFLIEEFGKDRGSALFDEQEKALNTIIKNTKNKSKQGFVKKRFYGRCRIQAYAKIYA